MVWLCLRSENLGTNIIKLCSLSLSLVSQSVATLARQLWSCKTTTGAFWDGSLFGSKPQAAAGEKQQWKQRGAQHHLLFPQLSQKNREISRPLRRLHYKMQHLSGIVFFFSDGDFFYSENRQQQDTDPTQTQSRWPMIDFMIKSLFFVFYRCLKNAFWVNMLDLGPHPRKPLHTRYATTKQHAKMQIV